MVRIAINGFGRIGRMIFRSLCERPIADLEIVAINDLAPPDMLMHLLQHDSIHSRFKFDLQQKGNSLIINGNAINFSQESEIDKLTWKNQNIDLVYECSGKFTEKEQAALHIKNGAKKVIISAPSSNADATIVFGVNHKDLNNEQTVISNSSCTTNCLAPIAYILNEAFGIEHGYMTTVHAYTSDQKLQDLPHHDWRRARAACISMIPTSTGAARTLGKVIKELDGKLDGSAIRVPTPNVSLIDLSVTTKKSVSVSAINDLIKTKSENAFKDIVEYSDEPLVSIDFNHNPHSAIFDATETKVIGKNFCRILAWYDNEWGFSCRMNDITHYWFKNI